MKPGQRVQITKRITALGVTSRPGEKGTVKGTDPDGNLTLRMDNGRPQFAAKNEVTPLN
jgi:hypothetical protein